jgi:hypothetical protein
MAVSLMVSQVKAILKQVQPFPGLVDQGFPAHWGRRWSWRGTARVGQGRMNRAILLVATLLRPGTGARRAWGNTPSRRLPHILKKDCPPFDFAAMN